MDYTLLGKEKHWIFIFPTHTETSCYIFEVIIALRPWSATAPLLWDLNLPFMCRGKSRFGFALSSIHCQTATNTR